jgi:long-chain acyl-CoA synthetase
MGRMEGGLLYLSGRAGRMVTVADQNVFPEELEAIMANYPGVRRVAVIPRPDALRGSVMVAVIMGDSAQEASILRQARADFGPLRAPRSVVWLDAWPVLPSGKSDFITLSQMVVR